ncbi:MAG: hypothetical protein HND48_06440 [Chloroflexi bacterium]|nr:hypothetical protein [Chloroflexota bacterium]
MRHLFSLEFTFSKRLLRLMLVAVGLLGNGALIAFDIIRQSGPRHWPGAARGHDRAGRRRGTRLDVDPARPRKGHSRR